MVEAYPTNEGSANSSNQLAEAICHPGPGRCAPCFSALAKRQRRWRQIVSWRNSQLRALSKWYNGRARYRAARVRYWATPYYRAIYKQYLSKHRYINRVVAAWTKTMNWRYANCK